MDDPYDFWNSAIASALAFGKTNIPKVDSYGAEVPRPETSGLFKRSVGERKGQIADWRASIKGSKRGVHVVEFEDYYAIHIDRYDPYKEPVKHVLVDSPRTLLGIAVSGVLAALFFSILRRRR